MKKLIAALLCLSPLAATANDGFRGRPNVDVGIDFNFGGGGIEFRAGDDGFVSWNDDLYVPTGRECNLVGVYVGVRGGDVEINDLDVVFGNGESQDIRVRQYFEDGGYSNVKALRGGKRCIMGFKIDAEALNRWRSSRARVTLYAQQVRPNGRIREIELGTVRISDYFNRREWHGRWGNWRRHDHDRRDDRRDRRDGRPGSSDDGFQICINGICVSN